MSKLEEEARSQAELLWARVRRADIIAAAKEHRFRNPELAAQALAGEDGDPVALVQKLAEENPYLREPSMNELLRAAAGKKD